MRKIANKIFFFLFVSLVTLQTSAQNAICKKDNIFSVRSRISVSRTELGEFDYYYQFKKSADLDTPVIIVIPGGPGGTSIDLQQENPYFDWTQILYGFPQKYNAILTDPRSVGCNSGNHLPLSSFTSENVANDIISIIKSLGLKKYILYGHSYGTVVATMTASQIEKEGITRPLAVVLSGTLGKYFENHRDDVVSYYFKAWDNVYNHLPENIKAMFPPNGNWSEWTSSLDKRVIANIPASDIYNFIFSNLTEGSVYLKGVLKNSLIDKLLLLDGHDIEALNELKKEISLSISASGNKELILRPFHDAIWCRELEKHQGPECAALGLSFDHPYDSTAIQILNTNILYIHGEFDTSVPIDMGDYHFLNQHNIKKLFLMARDGGHSTTMALTDCKESFWQAITMSVEDVKLSVKKCVGVEIRTPQARNDGH